MQPRNSQISQIARAPMNANAGQRARSWLTSPRGLLLVGIAVIAAGLALGWNWIVALGLAPIVLAIAPCALMCALGMCMMGMGHGKTTGPTAAPEAKMSEPVSCAISEADVDSQRTDERT
ncbi:MAG TPA: hypothetical protein VGR52_00655 [Stellaceae bacterium]|nr:hypothetical protein [Stellaceae bacterium]